MVSVIGEGEKFVQGSKDGWVRTGFRSESGVSLRTVMGS